MCERDKACMEHLFHTNARLFTLVRYYSSLEHTCACKVILVAMTHHHMHVVERVWSPSYVCQRVLIHSEILVLFLVSDPLASSSFPFVKETHLALGIILTILVGAPIFVTRPSLFRSLQKCMFLYLFNLEDGHPGIFYRFTLGLLKSETPRFSSDP